MCWVARVQTGDCIVVDPCWDIDGIKHVAKVNRMRLVAAVATHAHPDHIGGYYPFPLNLFLQKGAIPGIKELVNEGLQVRSKVFTSWSHWSRTMVALHEQTMNNLH